MIVHYLHVCVCVSVYVVFMRIHNLTIRQKSVLIALKPIPFASLNVILFVGHFLFFSLLFLYYSFFHAFTSHINQTDTQIGPAKISTEHVSHLVLLLTNVYSKEKKKSQRVEIMTDSRELSIHDDINLDAMYVIRMSMCGWSVFMVVAKCMLVLLICRCRCVFQLGNTLDEQSGRARALEY